MIIDTMFFSILISTRLSFDTKYRYVDGRGLKKKPKIKKKQESMREKSPTKTPGRESFRTQEDN